jgi:hypothetical protein
VDKRESRYNMHMDTFSFFGVILKIEENEVKQEG